MRTDRMHANGEKECEDPGHQQAKETGLRRNRTEPACTLTSAAQPPDLWGINVTCFSPTECCQGHLS